MHWTQYKITLTCPVSIVQCPVLLFYMCIYTFQVFINANPIKFICVFCVLNINVSLQLADTIIVNMCAQLVDVRGYIALALWYALHVIKYTDNTIRPTLRNWLFTSLLLLEHC